MDCSKGMVQPACAGFWLTGSPGTSYWGRGLKQVKAVVPHASLCSSLVKSGWHNIVGLKDTFKRPCPRVNEAWDWMVLRHGTEEFGPFLVSE